MMIILKTIEIILYFILGTSFLTITYNAGVEITAFIRIHVFISIAAFLSCILFIYVIAWIIAFALGYRRRKLGRSLKIFIIAWAIAGYMYYAYIMNSPFPWTAIVSTVAPIQISKLGISTSDNEPSNSFSFPLLKSSFLRLWYDLQLAKNLSFPSLHYYVESDFYYYNGTKIDRSRRFICIFKNVGNKSLIVNEFKAIVIRRNGMIRFNGSYVDYPGSQNLVDELNKKIAGNYKALRPMILYPMEEIELFSVELACTLDPLSIETEIEYSEYDGGYPNDASIHEYRQIDEVKFDSESPKILSARTKYENRVRNIGELKK